MKFFKFLAAVCLSLYLVNIYVIPIKKVELYGIYKLHSVNSGLKKGAVKLFETYKLRYKYIILNMLENSSMGSFNARGSFLFAELMLDDPQINSKVTELSTSHPEKQIRCFWYDALKSEHEDVVEDIVASDNSSNFVPYRAKKNDSICE